jgi:ribonucleotide reductase alpha subunit
MVLKNFVNSGSFDFHLLFEEARKVVRALNKVVDINNYSTAKGEKGGREQRAIAIGTQGLADVFYLMDYIFTSEEARILNKRIVNFALNKDGYLIPIELLVKVYPLVHEKVVFVGFLQIQH